MNLSKTPLLFACLILFLSSSCKRQPITKTVVDTKDSTAAVVKNPDTTPTTVAVVPNPPVVKVEEVAPKKTEKALVQVNNVDFNYIKLKSKLNFKNASIDQAATAVFHIKKDSAIWFSINVSVVEASRGVITQDSIHFFAFDPKTFKRNYYDLSLDSLSQKFNFDFNFKLLQALLVGNMPIQQNDMDSVSVNGNLQTIHQLVSPVLLHNFISTDTHKLMKLVANPESGKGEMTILYDNFLPINNFLFPQNDNITILSEKEGKTMETDVALQHIRVEFVNENPGFVFKKR